MRKIGMAVRVLLVIALAGPGLVAGVQAQGEDDGLVAEWHFDEGSGGVLADSSGNGNDGVIHGATWVEGKCEYGLRFDGVDDRISLGNKANLHIPGAITLSAWVKPSGLMEDGVIIRNGLGYDLQYSMFAYKDGSLGFHWYAGSFQNVKTDSGLVSLNGWTHIVAVRDNNNFIKLYVNGKLEKAEQGSSETGGGGEVNIGSTQPGAIFQDFNGIIDEVRIYNCALSPEKVKKQYTQGSTAVSLTKTLTPHSIKQSQTTTVTLTVTNTGTTEIIDIEVLDTILSDLTFVSGETSKTYTSLRPKDSREFQYTIQLNEAGTFNLDPATATYADEEGNYHTAESSTVAVEVIPATGTTPAQVRPTHRAATALSITKSPSLNSIRQFGETIITLSIKNSGTTDVTDIEITDRVHPSFDLTSGDFSNPKRYDLIRPGETRDLQYTITAKEGGTFTLDHANITYADADGNIQEAESEPYVIRVIPSTSGSTAGASHQPSSISTASVHLHGEKTDVVLGEDILLKLSAVNKITKPTMTLQVILIPPSSMSVTSADFVESGAGLYTSTYVIEPGVGRDIEVGIRSNQVGDFVVNGEVIYYFGDDKENAEEHLLSLPIKVRASPDPQQNTPTPTATSKDGKGIPGFEAAFAATGVLLVALLVKGRR